MRLLGKLRSQESNKKGNGRLRTWLDGYRIRVRLQMDVDVIPQVRAVSPSRKKKKEEKQSIIVDGSRSYSFPTFSFREDVTVSA